MPLIYQHNINGATKLGVWHITEEEDFFLRVVPLNKGINHWHKRLQHLAGRYLLHELFPGFPYHLIEIADTRKPFLPDEAYHFSISHCGDFAAVIVSKDQRVGVDIEIPTIKTLKIKHKFLTLEELDFAAGMGEEELTMRWCAKEAIFKWWGGREIDFREHIHLAEFDLAKEGEIPATFLKNMEFPLLLEYKMMEKLCLAWVATPAKPWLK